MKFSQMIKVEQQQLPVSARHDKWLTENSNAVYSPEAVEFMQVELTKGTRDRKGTVSASGLNSCIRRQQFTFLGMPEAPPAPKTAQIFHTGTFMHLRWQMAGITEGWLPEAEVPVRSNRWKLSGTMDGVLYNGYNLELKSINSNGYRGVMQFGVKDDHYSQVGTYMVVNDMEASSVIYENKDTQEYHEVVVRRDDAMEKHVEQSADRVWTPVLAQHLVEPLAACEERTGYRYTGCPFRGFCLETRSWAHAEEVRGRSQGS